MIPLSRMISEFHDKINCPPWRGAIEDMPIEMIKIRNDLLREEVRELGDAELASDLVGIADGLADIVYVAYGTAYTYGIDLDEVLLEVHRSNMTKESGPTGKATKGPNYSPPDIASVLKQDSKLVCEIPMTGAGDTFTFERTLTIDAES